MTLVFGPPPPAEKVASERALPLAAAGLVLVSTVLGRALTVVEPGVHDAELFRLFGEAWLDGRVPYRSLWNNKPPGIFAAAALLQALVPSWAAGVAAFETLAVVASALAVYRLVRIARPSESKLPALAAGAACAAALNLAALNEGGFTTELALAPFAAWAGLLFVLGWLGGSRLTLTASGALAGVAGLFKPPGLAPMLAALTFAVVVAAKARTRPGSPSVAVTVRPPGGQGAFLLGSTGPALEAVRARPSTRTVLAALATGAALAWAPVIAYFGLHGAARDMLDASFLFNFGYAAANRAGPFTTVARTGLALLPVAPLAAATAALAISTLRDARKRERLSLRVFVLLWVAWDLIGLVAGGRFYGHYVLAAVPSLATAAGLWLTRISDRRGRRTAVFATAFLLLPLLVEQAWEARALTPAAAARRGEPYWEGAVDAILRERAGLEGSHTLFTWDYLPAVYVHSGLLPPVRHPCAPIWGRQEVRDSVAVELLSALERTRPTFMVDGGTRYPVPGRDPEAFRRYQSILNRGYRLLYVDAVYGIRVFQRFERG